MTFYEVAEIYESTSKIDESTKAAMLWVATDEDGLKACILGENSEILRMYRSIFLGVLPLAQEQGWLKV